MMENLLHERLREHTDDEPHFICDGSMLVRISRKGAQRIAEEIERCYIPRPRFEDGEPVQFGDETDNLESVNIIEFRQDGTFQLGEKRESGWGTYIGIYEAGELVKRPTPKVYDADEMDIKRNDSVYPIKKKCNSDTEGYIVNHIEVDDGINSPRVYFIDDVGMSWLPARQLTHERPVFDAESVRICKGDTVYDVDGINPEPMRVLSYGDALVNVMSKSGIEKSYEFNELTHREPDSLERLRDDIDAVIEMSDGSNVACDRKGLEGVRDRLTALIERGA